MIFRRRCFNRDLVDTGLREFRDLLPMAVLRAGVKHSFVLQNNISEARFILVRSSGFYPICCIGYSLVDAKSSRE